MALSQPEIRDKEFEYERRGYAAGEVRQFLGEVADRMAEIADEKTTQARCSELESAQNRYRELEETLTHTLVGAPAHRRAAEG